MEAATLHGAVTQGSHQGIPVGHKTSPGLELSSAPSATGAFGKAMVNSRLTLIVSGIALRALHTPTH